MCSTGRLSDWRLRSRQPGCLEGYGKSGTGHCGGVGPSETEEDPNRSFAVRRTGNVEAAGTL
jgi:hypothetical protein